MSDIQKEIDIFLANNKQTWHTEDDLLCLINAYVAGHSSRDTEVEELKKEIERLKRDRLVTLDIVDGGKSDAYEKLSNIKAFLNL